MASDAAAGPTTELGRPGGGGGVGPWSAGSWASYTNEAEHVPDMRWPRSIQTFERMLFTDSQASGLFTGLTLPILNYTWWIEPPADDQLPQLSAMIAEDLGLPLGEPADGQEQPAVPGLFRFDFGQHLSEALLALGYGHYYFEIVGEVGDDGLWHLRKLGSRAPHTIADFDVAEDGGLRAIRQNIVTIGSTGLSGLSAGVAPPIPVDRLVGYIWRPDARARWSGRSMLRPLHKHWILKDKLMRVDTVNHERAGGVPKVTTDDTYRGSNLQDLAEIASAFRVGEDAGLALPPGADLSLVRVGGTDVVGSMRYHDEQMAFAWSSMVRQLGSTHTGSRALGGTFEGLEELARRAVASWFAGTFREHLIEKWWSYNAAPDAQGRVPAAPSLKFRPHGDQSSSVEQPVQQADQQQDPSVQASAGRRGCRELADW